MEPATTLTAFERTFFLFTGLGVLGFAGKRYHLFPSWSLPAFLKADGVRMLRAAAVAMGMAWVLPDLFLQAGDLAELKNIVAQHARLAEKGAFIIALLVGYTGGSIGFDIIELFYRLPLLGPLLKQAVDLLRAKLGLRPLPPPPATTPRT